MRKKKLSISALLLKYNSPANFSHLVTFGQKAEMEGHDVSYILSEGYRWVVDEFEENIDVVFLGKSADARTMISDTLKFCTIDRGRIRNILEKKSPDLLFFGDLHPAYPALARVARQTGCRQIWWWLHEPCRKGRKQAGWWRHYYYAFSEYFQLQLLNKVDLAMLSSQKALDIFAEHYPWFYGKVVQAPLVFPDYFESSLSIAPKYATFVGNAYPAKGVDIFFKLVEYASNNRPDIEFQIVTASRIQHYLTGLSAHAQKRLKIINRDRISDRELGKALRQSLVVLTPYRSSTQSGVVPAAFMHGIPVISTKVGAMAESVRPGETGILLPVNAPHNDWLKSFDEVKANRETLSKNCRQWYENHYSPANWLKVFPDLFNGLE